MGFAVSPLLDNCVQGMSHLTVEENNDGHQEEIEQRKEEQQEKDLRP
jgi:hypothetical protein